MGRTWEYDNYFFMFEHVNFGIVEKAVYPSLDLAIDYREALCKKRGIDKDTMPIFKEHVYSSPDKFVTSEPCVVA